MHGYIPAELKKKRAKQYFSREKSLKASYCAVKMSSNLLCKNNSLCNLGVPCNTVFISEITVLWPHFIQQDMRLQVWDQSSGIWEVIGSGRRHADKNDLFLSEEKRNI